MRLAGVLTGLLYVLLTFGVASAPSERFVSPTGSGSTYSQASPGVMDAAIAASAPGDFVTALNGTYQGASHIVKPLGGKSGLNAAPITIRALNEGQVVIDGQFARVPMDFGSSASWWVVEGLNVKNGWCQESTSAAEFRSGANNIIVRRSIFWDNCIYSNGYVLHVGGGLNITFEDVAAFGTGRSMIGLSQGGGGFNNVMCIRCFGNWGGSTAQGPKDTYQLLYNARGFRCINCIAMNTGESMPEEYDLISTSGTVVTHKTGFSVDQPHGGYSASIPRADNNDMQVKIYGSLTLVRAGDVANSMVRLFGFAVNSPQSSNIDARHLFAFISPSNPRFNNVNGFNLGAGSGINLDAQNLTSVRGSTGDTINATWGVGSSLSAGTSLAAVADPWTTTGAGANLCKRRNIDGSETTEPLWPWPMNQRIKDATLAAGAYNGPCIGCSGGRFARESLDVTAIVQAALGTIPGTCLAGETTPPPQPPPPPAGGIIVPTQIHDDIDPADGTVYTIPSHTVHAGKLLTLAVTGAALSGTVPTPTIAGHSATWVLVNSVGTGSPERKLFVFRTMVGSDSTGTITITFGSTQGRASWSLTEWGGVDTSGTNGSGAVVQSNVAAGAGTVAVSLNALGGLNNRVYATYRSSSGAGLAEPEAGWTALSNDLNSGEGMGHLAMWKNATDDLSPQATGGDPMLGVALEIRAMDLTRPAVPSQPTVPSAPAVPCRPAVGTCGCGTCADPTTPVLDDFNRANEGPPPSASWINNGEAGLRVLSNVAAGQSATAVVDRSVWNTTLNANQEAYADIAAINTANEDYLGCLHLQRNDSNHFYDACLFQFTGATNDTVDLAYWDGVTYAILKTCALGADWAAGDPLRFVRFGVALRLFHKGQLLCSVTHAALAASSKIGLAVKNQHMTWDNFGGGSLP